VARRVADRRVKKSRGTSPGYLSYPDYSSTQSQSPSHQITHLFCLGHCVRSPRLVAPRLWVTKDDGKLREPYYHILKLPEVRIDNSA
jgi:hypothetical protein